jgi:uncharacterized protein (DUF433 family)
MSVVETGYEHITVNEDGLPIIAGTRTKVVELVVEKMAYGWSPEEFHLQHPYLTLAQIYSAFGYYWDHTEEIHEDIQRRAEYIEQIRRSEELSPLVARLKAQGLL